MPAVDSVVTARVSLLDILMLSMLGKNVVDNIMILFSYFSRKDFDSSCTFSPKEEISKSGKIRKISSVCHLLNKPREC